jgi:uncharacterized protein YjbI with pentapeptide repeats
MRSETVGVDNFATIDWEENYFKFCEFENLSVEGKHISSDFVSCSFVKMEWYWGLFNCANFVNCLFTDCVFRGTAFPDCKFVECTLTNCRFVKDNLAANCDFSRAIAYGCTINGGEGFKAELYRAHLSE